MTDFLDSTADICARIGEDPDRRGPLDDMLKVLDKAGYPTSKGRLYKAQMRRELRYVIHGNRAIHRVADELRDFRGSRTAIHGASVPCKAGPLTWGSRPCRAL